MILGVPATDRRIVPAADQQPFRLRGARLGPSIGPDQDEPAPKLLPLEPDLELACAQRIRRFWLARLRRPPAPVPHDDVATSILPGWDHALEPEVVQRVVLDLDSQPLCRRSERRTAWHGPGRRHAADLEAQVVMESASPITVDDASAADLR